MALSKGQRVAYLGTAASVGVFSAFNNFTMSLWLTQFTSSYVLISLLGNSKSLEGAVVAPTVGVLSDRTWAGWLGRRRLYILMGGLVSAVLISITPLVARMPPLPWLADAPDTVARLGAFILVDFLFTLTFNVADDVHNALRADLTEDAELNRLSALDTMVNIGAQVAILFLGFVIWNRSVPDAAFLLAGALVAAGALATTLGVREPPPEAWAPRSTQVQAEAAASRLSWRTLLSRYRGAFMFCMVSFAYWSGVNAILPLISIYVRDILGTTVGEAQLLPGLLLLSTSLLALPAGWLGTIMGKRRTLALGYALMGAAAIAGLLITTKEQGMLLFFLAGAGNSAAVVLAIPMMADLVPRRNMGAAAGLLAAAGSVAAPLASLAGGSLSQIYGPRAIFGVMAVMTGLAILLLLGVHPLAEHAVAQEGA